MDSGFWILRCGFRIPGAGFWNLPLWVPEIDFREWIPASYFFGILNSKSCILDSRFHKQKYPGFRNPDCITWADTFFPFIYYSFESYHPDLSHGPSTKWIYLTLPPPLLQQKPKKKTGQSLFKPTGKGSEPDKDLSKQEIHGTYCAVCPPCLVLFEHALSRCVKFERC